MFERDRKFPIFTTFPSGKTHISVNFKVKTIEQKTKIIKKTKRKNSSWEWGGDITPVCIKFTLDDKCSNFTCLCLKNYKQELNDNLPDFLGLVPHTCDYFFFAQPLSLMLLDLEKWQRCCFNNSWQNWWSFAE